MKILTLSLTNVRSFAKLEALQFSKSINLFVGENNSGKSTVLRSILTLQHDVLEGTDTRLGERDGRIDISTTPAPIRTKNPLTRFSRSLNGSLTSSAAGDSMSSFSGFSSSEPLNIIYPYLANRKVAKFSNVISEEHASSIYGNHSFLFSKIDRLNAPQYSKYKSYASSCLEVLGFEVGTVVSGNGKIAGMYADGNKVIPIPSMGEGVVNALGLIVDLVMAEDKIFVIEELENDLHPKALKALLSLIVQSSTTNQFIISTHSNIVLRHLGAAPDAKVFYVKTELPSADTSPRLFTSTVELCETEVQRRKVLSDLGYDLFDADLWDGWIFFEESSAEEIVREFLIPWFCPTLNGRIRTFSARSLSQVSPKFEEFNRLFVYLHLTPTYKNKAWVIVDAGDAEKKVIEEMRFVYAASDWNKEQFIQLLQHDFERYYPAAFTDKVDATLAIDDKVLRREAKAKLLASVKAKCQSEPDEMKAQFAASGKEIIDFLEKIASSLGR